jgi:glucosylceramidase
VVSRLKPRIPLIAAVMLTALAAPAGAVARQHTKALAPPVRVAVVQTTSDLADRLTALPGHTFGRRRASVTTIHVDDTRRYQRFIGVGGAMTDSSAWLIWDQLTPGHREQLLRDLFSAAGAHIRFLRIPIGASDFITGPPYTYDDMPAGQADPTLAHFSIGHDQAYILPALRAALALNPAAYLEAVPWTPPAWMKANDTYDNPGNTGSLLPADYPVDAAYDVRFLQAYAAAGVPVQAISPENEPGQNTLIPAMQMTEPEEAQLISQDLKPALARAHLSPAIFGWDLSWGPLGPSDGLVALAQQGQIGLSFHCYQGSPLFMTGVHAAAPAATQIVDECATGSFDSWNASEVMIASLRNWASAVGMWDLALDPTGGPVLPPNTGCQGCTGLATIANGGFTLSLNYYELAQLSRFVQLGARRISSDHTVSYQMGPLYTTQVTQGLDDVAFENPDGTRVLLVHSTAPGAVRFNVEWHGRFITLTIPADATATLTWRPA